jgi:hypothetical protein
MKTHQIPLRKYVDIVAVAVTLRDDQLLKYLMERFLIDDLGATPKQADSFYNDAFTQDAQTQSEVNDCSHVV